MYQIAICDDEDIFLKHLCTLAASVLRELACKFEVSRYSDGRALLQALERQPDRFQLLLLDILMEPLDGVTLAKRLRQLGCSAGIVFVTSTAAFSLEGYSVYPAQYLVKPVTRQQLLEAISRDYRERYLPKHVMLPIKGGNAVLPLNDILYLETINRLTLVHTSRECLESSDALKKLLLLLPQSLFVRCHKSYVVNLQKVARMNRSGVFVEDAGEIPVGRAYYDTAARALVEYLGQA